MLSKTHSSFAVAALVIFAGGCDNCGRSIGNQPDAAIPDAQVEPDAETRREIEYTVYYLSAADINVGDTSVHLIKVRMKNRSNETAMVDTTAFAMHHFPWFDLANIKLTRSGTHVQAENFNSPGSLDMLIDLMPDYGLEPGVTVSFELQGDVTDGLCRSIDARFDDEKTDIFGETTDLPFLLYPSPESEEVVERKVVGFGYRLESDPNDVPEAFIPAGSANIPALTWTILSNHDSTMERFQLEISYTSDASAFLNSFRVWRKTANDEWLVVALGYIDPDNCTETSCTLAIVVFRDSFEVEGDCYLNEYKATLDIDRQAPNNSRFQVLLYGTSIEAYDTNQNPIPPPQNTIYGNFQTVISL